MFGCNGKYNFPKIVFLLTRIYAFDPEMNLHSHFHFNSFPGHAKRTATQREREKRNTKCTRTQRERELRSIFQPPKAPIQPPRPPIQPPKPPIQPLRAPSPKRNCLRREWEKEPTAPIYLTPVTPSSARWSPPRPTPDPTQPVDHRSSHSDHRAKHFITVSFPSPVHRPHTHLTSDPHMSDPHTHRSDPISALYIYIYIIYFFFIY